MVVVVVVVMMVVVYMCMYACEEKERQKQREFINYSNIKILTSCILSERLRALKFLHP